MGLAGRKQKQRIPADPRNLSWADDASRFGLSYLSKFGWDASKGLGSSGDGMKTHIKVQQKLDMMGIGAQHQRDPNGTAWKQNKDFEALLKKLNESAAHENGDASEDVEKAGEKRERAVNVGVEGGQETKDERKVSDSSSAPTKKRHKNIDSDTKRVKKRKKEEAKSGSDVSSLRDSDSPTAVEDQSVLSLSNPDSEPIPKPRPMAHRARIRAAKRIADKSASAISEILGIAPSSTGSTSTPTPVPTPTPPSHLTPPSMSLDNLTTSTKNLADYFKEKLLSRSSSSPTSSSSALSGCATPGLGTTGLGFNTPNVSVDDEDEPPRRGLGSRLPVIPPPAQVSESGLTSRNDDRSCDMPTEDQHRNAKCKTEEREKRGTEHVEQTAEDTAEETRRKPKEKKKRKKGARS